ncbi:YgjV family protein [Methylorubrum thiocyanatum]|uniref:F0F1-type ATP synthase membrane subunit c/vacuolar-type H+-ATPase subunit K n=1 Tax=Methylorubrum thiocyanatum TaxID=47958 RepID=A0AA40S629_9HYPH|nr:YgjV family protein [Methylorubrum thiocyanatum]MBA8915278.1 F0F1-type ATP synthase membrane subunit c/vacuolar-type H+-ATPase subunit K [Methylorubrum thiocyanatum]GJE81878.1 hypothetical protein CJNNKLLH_3234 [Methylorubrum thiocyanatum]
MSPADLVFFAWHAARDHLDLFGSLGLCLGFAGGMMPRRSLILFTSAACSACFALHFLQLGAQTGTAMCLVSVMQSVVAARWIGAASRAPWVAPLFVASSLVAMGLTLATWNGWPSACAGLGSLLATTARLQADPQAMRRFFLGSSSCWALHNTLVGSVFGLTCDLLTLTALVIALVRGGASAKAVKARSTPAPEPSVAVAPTPGAV